jgi:hypothetical protein
MRQTISGWILFFGGLGIEFASDYLLRMRDGDIKTGGFPEVAGFLIQAILALVSILFLYKGVQSQPRLWYRIAIVSCQVVIAFAIYAVLGLWYVTGTGVDSL